MRVFYTYHPSASFYYIFFLKYVLGILISLDKTYNSISMSFFPYSFAPFFCNQK